MNAQHENLGTAVVFCLGTAGYLAMLSADGRERIRVWGRLVSLWRSGSLYDGAGRRGPARADDGGTRGCRPTRRRARRARPPDGSQARTPGRWPRRAGG